MGEMIDGGRGSRETRAAERGEEGQGRDKEARTPRAHGFVRLRALLRVRCRRHAGALGEGRVCGRLEVEHAHLALLPDAVRPRDGLRTAMKKSRIVR
jgi:hypothetical protein